jgi:hypothetical protein
LPDRLVQHPRQTSLLLRDKPKNFLPDLVIFHAKIYTGSRISILQQLLIKVLIHLNPQCPEVSGFTVKALDELFMEKP